MYKGQYVCASIKHKTWFEFENHKWVEIDSGTTLREKISRGLMKTFSVKMGFIKDAFAQGLPNPMVTSVEQSAKQNKIRIIMQLC